jgi:cupin 2 domain-containing protein
LFSNPWKTFDRIAGFAGFKTETFFSPSIRKICYRIEMNLFDNIPENAPEELTEKLLSAEGARIERIVSFGQRSPDDFWYDQEENEWVLLLEGSATLSVEEGGLVDLKPGDYLNIPAGKRHRVEKTDKTERTVWLAVFYPPSPTSTPDAMEVRPLQRDK